MENFVPKTYNEALRMARCEAVRDYMPNLPLERVQEMYQFLTENPENRVMVADNMLLFQPVDGELRPICAVEPITGFDSLTLGWDLFHVLGSFRSSGSDDSGISGNNNNNNNNNNG